jgi:hypothetical protein
MNIQLNREEVGFVMEGLDLAAQQANKFRKLPRLPGGIEWLKKDDWEKRRDSIKALFIRVKEEYNKTW